MEYSILEEETEKPIITKDQLLRLLIKKAVEDDIVIKKQTDKILITQNNEDSEEAYPIYIVYEYQTKRSVKPITTTPYIYEKDIVWALKSNGSTILKINYELVNIKTDTFNTALSLSYNNIPSKEKPTEEEFKERVLKELRNKKL